MRKIILNKGQSPGDILVFTGVLRDLKRQFPDWLIDVRTCCDAIFENNPHITKLVENTEGVEYYDVGYDDIHNSGWSGRHFSTAYHLEIEKLLGERVKQNTLLPEVFLSDTEKGWMNQVEQHERYRGKFWLINAGVKGDYPLKQWGFKKWQKLVDILKGEIQFVQIGETGHTHQKLEGVIDLVGRTNLRELIRLAYHCEGSVCPVTFLMHLMAAYQKPCVVVSGGREPRRWEMYPNHRFMDSNGLLPCCSYDGCWQSGRVELDKDNLTLTKNESCKRKVGNTPKCLELITPQRVAEEVLNYEKNHMPLHSKYLYEKRECERKLEDIKKKLVKTKKDQLQIVFLKTRIEFIDKQMQIL